MAAPAEGYGRTDRIRRRSDYRRVQHGGQRVHTPHFIIILAPGEGHSRLGITVTRKVASAVGRNRVKRLVREVFRRNRSQFPASYDLVFIAKQGAQDLTYQAVLCEVERARGALRSAARRAQPGGGA